MARSNSPESESSSRASRVTLGFLFSLGRIAGGFSLRRARGREWAPGSAACLSHDFGQIVGQSWRHLQPCFQPASQVGHAIGTEKPQPLGQLAQRRLRVTAAEPSRYRSGQMRAPARVSSKRTKSTGRHRDAPARCRGRHFHRD